MKKLTTTILFACCLFSNLLYAQHADAIKKYIEAYKDLAMEEMIRSGVPASITLAQGIHESAAGTSNLVRRSNNHFGIKCKSEWKGASVSHDDDAKGECFRKYDDPADSYRDHSDFLKYRPHYASLFQLDPEDYEGWAYGLKKAGYATNPRYPQVLIKIIHDYNLQQYTLLALNKKNNQGIEWAANHQSSSSAHTEKPANAALKKVKKTYPTGVFTINDTKVVFVSEGTSYLKVAEEHAISLNRLFEFNDLPKQDIAAHDQLIYLQRKRKTGAHEYHIVQEGETLHDIAQSEGIRLETLLEYNSLTEKMQPAVGEKLHLNSKSSVMPKLAGLGKAMGEFITSLKEDTHVKPVTHVVQPRETLYSISRQYGVEMDELMQINGLQSTDLKIGQELKINKTRANGSSKASR